MSVRMIVLALLAASTGCASGQVPLTGRDHVSGWADQIRATAVTAYPYAQMSANAYQQVGPYDLGPTIMRVDYADNDALGFAYAVYDRYRGDALAEVVIAFRGTEFTKLSDWFYGNLLARQNPRGVAVFDRVRARVGPAVPITVTGHSLGGAIATHVSLRRKGAAAYVFNTSPRFWRGREVIDNPRVSIVEYGEVLKLARLLGRPPTQSYTSIGCTRGWNAVQQHGIRLLADCLTQAAAFEDAGARDSLARNPISWPPALPRR